MAAASAAMEELAEQKARLQEESHMLANDMLPQLTADKTGTLEVAVQGVRNVGPEEAEEEDEDNDDPVPELRFLVEVVPATVIEPAVDVEASEEDEDQETASGSEEQVAVKLGQSAKFRLTSLEAKVVVHFGSQLEHYVRVPLHNKYKEAEMQQLSGWHSSAVGEETETPEVRDVTGAPQVQLSFRFTRRNKEEILRATERLREIQEDIGALHDKEKELRRPSNPPSSPPKSILKGSGSGNGGGGWGEGDRRRASIRPVDEEDDDDGHASGYGPRALSLWRWIVAPFVIVIRIGRAAGAMVWQRRAIFLFVGGTLFFHFRGDDLAV